MDPFGEDREELTGSLMSMEFGPGGRITQLWAADPALPEEGEDFQFVLPPLAFGEESAEDYYPGTILIGARTDPNSPWILSRNGHAQSLFGMGEDLQPEKVGFEYELPLLPEIAAVGRFYEMAGPTPQIVWDLELRNRSRASIEIGELGFPLALNNFYDGFGWSDEQLRTLWNSRLYVHKFIGGAGSWLFAQRMTAEAPGLLVFPGDDTGWEFGTHVPASLNTPYQWEGIPVVYIFSRASFEREGWKPWANEHSSLILEPGELRTFQMRFVPTERDKQDGVYQALGACGRPAIRLLPGAVAPIDVGIALEVSGATPTRFTTSRAAQIETDSDEEGGFCFVHPTEPGPLRVTIEDTAGRTSHAHLMFTRPIEELIKARAEYICARQVHQEQGSNLNEAILLTDCISDEHVVDPEEYVGASGIECSLADALFLAEKNALFPVASQIATLERYIEGFLRDEVQNPSDMSVASIFSDGTGPGIYAGRPLTYPHVFNLYHSMSRVADTYGATSLSRERYLELAAGTASAMFKLGWRHYVRSVGMLGYAQVFDLLSDLRAVGMTERADALERLVEERASEMTRQKYPYAGESILDTSGFEDVYCSGLRKNDDEHLERTIRCAYAARSLAPSWWWYGSDKRSWDGADSAPRRALIDRGEACLAHTTIPNSRLFFRSLDRDYLALPDAYMRLAFGGMLGPWALVRSDGAASMCYCPDPNSRHSGYNAYTGAGGLGYYSYLRGAGSYVLPNRELGLFTFGCHFEQERDFYRVRPWDGVGRRVILRQIGAEVHLEFGKLLELRLDARKRWIEATIANPADRDVRTHARIRGLWGSKVEFGGTPTDILDGEVRVPVTLPALETFVLRGRVIT